MFGLLMITKGNKILAIFAANASDACQQNRGRLAIPW